MGSPVYVVNYKKIISLLMFQQIPLFMLLLKFSKGKSKSKNFLAKEFVQFKSKNYKIMA